MTGRHAGRRISSARRESQPNALRTIWRDTMLHAALLDAGAQTPASHVWHARCVSLVDAAEQGMRDAGYTEAEIHEASLAQCALLDELTLRALPASQRGDWARASLQVQLHDTADGAEIVCDRIDGWLMGERSSLRSPELYRILFESGFRGARAARDSYRQRARRALDEIVRREAPAVEPEPMSGEPEAAVREPARPRRRWSARVAVLGAAGIAAVWLLLYTYLNHLTDRLPEPASAPVSSLSQGRT
jgi:type VI secretion system protein ImpK